MVNLNLPKYSYKIKNKENKPYIFDIIRKKYIMLTPEEWVRQHFVNFLIGHKNYPKSHLAVEKQMKINNLVKRTDILVFDRTGSPHVIVECKAPNIKISQNSFDQIARYNLTLDAQFLIVTNGIEHFYCKIDHEKQAYEFLEDLPDYG